VKKRGKIMGAWITLAIGQGLFWLPKRASACDSVCQCEYNAQADFAACQANRNSSACDNCAGDQSACTFDFRGCGEEAFCDPSYTCEQSCTGAYDAAREECRFGC